LRIPGFLRRARMLRIRKGFPVTSDRASDVRRIWPPPRPPSHRYRSSLAPWKDYGSVLAPVQEPNHNRLPRISRRSTVCHDIRLHRLVLVALTAALFVCAAERRQYDFQRKILPNGLTVITLEDHACPIVAVQVWYHVGSKDEDPERQGFAHMFEHMMFRGTDRLGPEAHFDHVRRTGGELNGFTSFDNTTYVNEAPSNQLELLFWLEAERMAFLKIDEEGFSTERSLSRRSAGCGRSTRRTGRCPRRLWPRSSRNTRIAGRRSARYRTCGRDHR